MKPISKAKLLEIATPIINKIAESRRGKTFAYYQSDDISQEVWVLCLDALDRFDISKASTPKLPDQIERYLNSHVSNRLKNLMRDKYFRPDAKGSEKRHAVARMNLVNALPIDLFNQDECTSLGASSHIGDPEQILMTIEMIEYIMDRLPSELIEPFMSIIDGNKIHRSVASTVQEKTREILRNWNDG